MDKPSAIGQFLRLLDGKLRSILKNETLNVKVDKMDELIQLVTEMSKDIKRISVESEGLSNLQNPDISLVLDNGPARGLDKIIGRLEEAVTSLSKEIKNSKNNQ